VATTLLLARHGETDWNREHRWQGHADPPLNDVGRAQARRLVALLAGERVDAVYASDLRRARDTAAAVGAARGLDTVAMPDLREIDVGEWMGLTSHEIQERFPDGWIRHAEGGDGWERGETHAAMSARVTRAAKLIAAAHPDGRVLCVLHGGVIRALLALAEGVELAEYRRSHGSPVNGSLSRITVGNAAFARID
jgi:broad specificity phosphatase PhoE